MKVGKVFMLIGLVVLVLSLAACEVSFSTANIGDAWMSNDEAGKNRTTVFAPDEVFYAQVNLRNAPDDTKLKAVWTAVEAESVEPNYVINETEFVSGSGQVLFNLSNTNPWPAGKYKVDIYLNDKVAKTLEFEVR
jgi:hypothetical protein